MSSYCQYISSITDLSRRALHQHYHDYHYGFPVTQDNELFGRLLLEINQAGLNWETVLKKEENIRQAYSNFDIKQVALYSDSDRERLLADSGIIRHRLKIEAAITNAQKLQEIISQYGSFFLWIKHHHPQTEKQWVALFRKNFYFVGGEIVCEFLKSIGILPHAHDEDCHRASEALKEVRRVWG